MEDRPIVKFPGARLLQTLLQELSIHRDIYNQLAAHRPTHRKVTATLIFYYGCSVAFTGATFHLVRAETRLVQMLVCGLTLSSYLMNGQFRMERDLLYRIGISEEPGAEVIRKVYISRAPTTWPGTALYQHHLQQQKTIAKLLPRENPLERFQDLPEFRRLMDIKKQQ